MILFRESMVLLILSGSKTVTRRRGKRRWKVGAIHQCYTRPAFARPPGVPFARVRIVSLHFELSVGHSTMPLSNRWDGLMLARDAEGRREGFLNWNDFRAAYAIINGGIESWHEPCFRVEFELVPEEDSHA